MDVIGIFWSESATLPNDVIDGGGTEVGSGTKNPARHSASTTRLNTVLMS